MGGKLDYLHFTAQESKIWSAEGPCHKVTQRFSNDSVVFLQRLDLSSLPLIHCLQDAKTDGKTLDPTSIKNIWNSLLFTTWGFLGRAGLFWVQGEASPLSGMEVVWRGGQLCFLLLAGGGAGVRLPLHRPACLWHEPARAKRNRCQTFTQVFSDVGQEGSRRGVMSVITAGPTPCCAVRQNTTLSSQDPRTTRGLAPHSPHLAQTPAWVHMGTQRVGCALQLTP